MNTQDPRSEHPSERLSEYLDGELAEAERGALEAHLARCAACTALLADLRHVVAAARGLGTRAPARDLWPGIERALAGTPRGFPRWFLAFAAGVLVTLGVAWSWTRARAEPAERLARGAESYLLLLHEPADFGALETAAEHAAVVERYARWAAELGERCAGGEELAEDGLELRAGAGELAVAPLAPSERVGGYFLLAVSDQDEALALARTCPHLERGGWIELRHIRTH